MLMPIRLAGLCALVFGTASMPTICQESPSLSQDQRMAMTMVTSCATGAIQATRALAPKKMTGDVAKDAELIANATRLHCVTQEIVSTFLFNRETATSEQRRAATQQAVMLYSFAVSHALKSKYRIPSDSEK
jgi:hypothetical protein